MGSGPSCALDHLSNLCEMHRCIQAIQGRAADSVSATDTWVCTLKPGTTLNGKPCTQAFMKIGVVNPANDRLSAGIIFECLVYDRLITPILDAQICPNFLRSYLVSTKCSYRDIEKALKIGLPQFSTEQLKLNLQRNISYMMNGQFKRPAIDTVTPGGVLEHDLYLRNRFIVISTEFNHVRPYARWLRDPTVTPTDRRIVLLQILIALRVMEMAQLMHNDLHTSNILIQSHEAKMVTYIIGGLARPITLVTTVTALIYDFDRASCQWLGNNRLWSDQPIFQANRDLACLYKHLVKRVQEGRVPPIVVEEVDAFFQTRQFTGAEIEAWSLCDGNDIQPSILRGIQAVAASLPADIPADSFADSFADAFGPQAEVYHVSPKMFMPDGRLNRGASDDRMVEQCLVDYQRRTAQLRAAEQEIQTLKEQLKRQSSAHRLRQTQRDRSPLRPLSFNAMPKTLSKTLARTPTKTPVRQSLHPRSPLQKPSPTRLRFAAVDTTVDTAVDTAELTQNNPWDRAPDFQEGMWDEL